jgi:hypothetical protein
MNCSLSARLFVRLYGGLLVVTFLSILSQASVLLGPQGLNPVVSSLHSPFTFGDRPSLLWLDNSLGAVVGVLLLGICGAVLMMRGRRTRLGAVICFVSYLSVVQAGGVFFRFQWDLLILESLALAALTSGSPLKGPSPVVVLAYRCLLFRLYFGSGVAKVLWGEDSWGRFVAMDHYYETAPLPLWLGWWAHQAPHAVHLFEQATTYAVELALPFVFVLAPQRWRAWSALPGLAFQIVIFLTASYGSFNLLSALLLLWLLDDGPWQSVIRRSSWLRRVLGHAVPDTRRGMDQPVTSGLAGIQLLLGALAFWVMVAPESAGVSLNTLHQHTEPFKVANAYHLFPGVTLKRPVVLIEGAQGGSDWKEYAMRWSPHEPGGAPPLLIGPHHPRVPFQMWFLALRPRQEPWLQRLLEGLCMSESPVHALFSHQPFDIDMAPDLLRYVLYDYRMTSVGSLWSNGRWWTRERLGTGSVFDCNSRNWLPGG